MKTAGRPSVTVAIPLHRSAPFVEVVLANIAAVGLPDAEIIVSDRTCLDDAAAQIAEATRADPRVRVIARPDGLDWVSHHAALLDEARADLAMLMPHDDDFPAGHVAALVQAMDEHPRALLAFGAMHWLGGQPAPPPPCPLDGVSWRAADAARLFSRWTIGQAYRGVLRLSELRRLGIRHRPRPQGAWCDDLFVFEVALAGRLVRVPEVVTYKRVHAGNTYTRWSTSPRRTLGLHLTALQILRQRGRDRTLPLAALFLARRTLGYLAWDLRKRRHR